MSRNTRLREYQIPVVIRDIPDKFEKVIHNPVFPGDIVEDKKAKPSAPHEIQQNMLSRQEGVASS